MAQHLKKAIKTIWGVKLKFEKGWFRLIIATSSITGIFFFLKFFNERYYYAYESGYLKYIPLNIVFAFIGVVVHILIGLILLKTVAWIKEGFKEN